MYSRTAEVQAPRNSKGKELENCSPLNWATILPSYWICGPTYKTCDSIPIICNLSPFPSIVGSGAVFQLSAYFVFVKVYSIPTLQSYISLVPMTPFRNSKLFYLYSSSTCFEDLYTIVCLLNKIFTEDLFSFLITLFIFDETIPRSAYNFAFNQIFIG